MRRILTATTALVASVLGPAIFMAQPASADTLQDLIAFFGQSTILSNVPVPEDDPFYAVPADVASFSDGEIIRTRDIGATVTGLPLPNARAWQLLYRTEDRTGRPTATVTTLLTPGGAWTGAGTRPLLSYQTAEDGVAGKCAPSYGYRANPLNAISNSYAEQFYVAQALQRGWAVSVPDYEGPQSQFLVAGMQSKGVLDGIRASLHFAPAGLDENTRIGAWGYSGGGLATLTAAQAQPAYAPELDLVAVAAGAPATDIRKSIQAFFDTGFAGGVVPMGVNGFLRAYPELDLNQYLSEGGRAKVAATAGDCIANALARYPGTTIDQIEATPGALDLPPVAAMLRENSPLYIAGVPRSRAAIYHYHAVNDELAPYAPALATMQRFCAAHLKVQEVAYPVGEHIAMVGVGAPGAMDFLGAQFNGDAPTDDCATIGTGNAGSTPSPSPGGTGAAAMCRGVRPTITGTDGSERIVGTPGDDVISALGGNDVVVGGGGNDLICGGRGKDRLFGQAGRDICVGGPGRDRARGCEKARGL